MGSDAQCTTTIEQHDVGDESNSSFLGQTNLYSIISCNNQGLNTNKQDHKVQLLISELANNENTLTITLTETHLNEKILDSDIQMKNYIGFRVDRTLGRKIGGVIIYIKATEAVDAEQLIAKSNSYVEYQLIHMKKRNIIIINVYRPPDCPIEKFSSPLNELRRKLLEIGNPMPNIIFTGDLNFPLTGKWKQQTVEPMKIMFKQIPFCNLHRNKAYSNI